jgi:hypothetical protein
VVAIPLLAMLLATVLFGVTLAQDRRAQDAVLHTVEVERQIAHVRIRVQAGVTGYVLTGERRYLTSYMRRPGGSCPRPSPSSATSSATTRPRPAAWSGSGPWSTSGRTSWRRWSPTSGRTGRRPAVSSCSTRTRRSAMR